MSLKDLTDGDFKFYQKYADDMRTCHEREFIKYIDPELMKVMYRGRNQKESQDNLDRPDYAQDPKTYMAMSRLFTATNTVIPNLYWQNPRVIVVPKRGATPSSAALMSAALNYYRKANKAKAQNQEAIMNAWFFGLGWKKVGYRTVLTPAEQIAQEPETMVQKVLGAMGMGGEKKTDNLQSGEKPWYVDYETLFNDNESPMNVMLDHKASLMNGQAIRHRVPRTLYDLMNYAGGYDKAVLDEIYEKMKYKSGSRLDSREIDLNLNELHIKQRNGIWILTYIDEHKKPLRYEKQDAEIGGFSLTPIRFDNEPGVRYPVSHLKVASQAQIKLDDMATLFYETVGKVRNQLLINQNDLAPGQKQALINNEIGGVVLMNKPITASTYAQLQSAAVQNDLPTLMTWVQQNITEITGQDEQMISGKSKNDTLGQDELARVGTKIRESGMIDRVRDWEIEQLRKEAALLKQYSSAKLALEVAKEDFANKEMAKDFESVWVDFMTMDNPLGLNAYLQGECDFELNMYEAIRPDKKAIAKECMEAITVYSAQPVREALLENNARARIDLLAEKATDQFEFIKGSDFIEHLDPMQVAAIQAKQVMMQSGGQVPGALTPKDAATLSVKSEKKESTSGEKISNPSASEITK